MSITATAWIRLLLPLAGLAFGLGEALAQDVETAVEVSIVGRTPPDNSQEFEWVVTNHTSQPIVRFRTQHFLGTVVVPPAGWVESAMTGNISRGQKQENGILEFTVAPGGSGIVPGSELAFRSRIHHTWSRYAQPRTVEVEFAGGRVLHVPGVQCPAQPPFLRDNYPVVGLGGMFAIFLIAQAVRRRRRRAATTPQ